MPFRMAHCLPTRTCTSMWFLSAYTTRHLSGTLRETRSPPCLMTFSRGSLRCCMCEYCGFSHHTVSYYVCSCKCQGWHVHFRDFTDNPILCYPPVVQSEAWVKNNQGLEECQVRMCSVIYHVRSIQMLNQIRTALVFSRQWRVMFFSMAHICTLLRGIENIHLYESVLFTCLLSLLV